MMPLTLIDLRDPLCMGPAPEITPLSWNLGVATDLATTPALRADALRHALPGPAIFTDETAVFIHTGFWFLNPRTLTMPQCAPVPGTSTRWTTDRRTLHESDVRGVVTTPVRTLADLAYLDDPARSAAPIRALIRAGANVEMVIDRLGSKYRGRSTTAMRHYLAQLSLAHRALEYLSP